MSANCQNCGAPSRHLRGLGTIYVFTGLDVEPLVALFHKRLDILKCENKGCPQLPGFPTVVVQFNEPPVAYLTLGSKAQSSRSEIYAELERTYDDDPDLAIEECSTLDSLRKAVGGRLTKYFKVINPVLTSGSPRELQEYVSANWRKLTAESFAAMRVVFSAPVPSVQLFAGKDNDEKSPIGVSHKLARAQSLVWLLMVVEWPNGEGRDQLFEDDLQKFIVSGAILPEAPEIFFSMLSSLEGEDDLSPLVEYRAHAARASVYAALDRPNPQAGDWAGIFVAHELACRSGGNEVSDKVRAMAVSEERARNTIEYQPAWNAIVPRLEAARRLDTARMLERLKILDDIAAKAGHPHLVHDILTEGQEIESLDNIPITELIELFRSVVASAGGTEGLLQGSKRLAEKLLLANRIDDLERFGEAMVDMLGGDNDARARVDAWVGSWLKVARLPQRLLNRIGEVPRNWEYELKTSTRVMLWTERANTFRLLGRFDDAHLIYEEIYRSFLPEITDADQRVARRNYGISLRETGAPDAALNILIPLLEETPESDFDRIDLLHSIATTYQVLGQHAKALPFLDEAVSLARGPRAKQAPLMRIFRANISAALGKYDDAIEEIRAANIDESKYPVAPGMELSTWAILIANDATLPAWANERIHQLKDGMTAFIQDAATRHDARLHLDHLHLLAWLSENLGEHEESLKWWQTAISTAIEVYNFPPEVAALVSVACYAYETGKTDVGRSHLLLIPESDASHLGGTTDLSIAVDSSRRIQHAFNRLAKVLIRDSGQDWQDIRLIAELKRDVIGRAQTVRRRRGSMNTGPFFTGGLSDAVISRLAVRTGTVAVVEWIDDGDEIAAFLTMIAPDGQVGSEWLMAPHFSLGNVAKRITKRLRDWRPSRSGDPFDFPDWVSLESWISNQLEPYLPEGAHVVIIEHQDFVGIPWHVALGRQWTCSYTSGWTSLLSLFDLRLNHKLNRIGVLLAPRFNESSEILTSLRASVTRTQAFAQANNLSLATAEETLCDKDAVARIMATTDVTKLLCHGYVDPVDGEVALMIAHDGGLPLAHSVASASEFGIGHRLSWRDFQVFTAAPPIVFSAACSTGISHLGGLGERLGFFSGLRHVGTRALVAPQWNIVAASVIPILDEALENYVVQGGTLAQALRSACLAAEKNNPRWSSWALTLEGDWR